GKHPVRVARVEPDLGDFADLDPVELYFASFTQPPDRSREDDSVFVEAARELRLAEPEDEGKGRGEQADRQPADQAVIGVPLHQSVLPLACTARRPWKYCPIQG